MHIQTLCIVSSLEQVQTYVRTYINTAHVSQYAAVHTASCDSCYMHV